MTKFSETKILEEIDDYIHETYKKHYGFCIGNIMKYAMRYGKKDNKRLELLKIIHYAIIALHIEEENG